MWWSSASLRCSISAILYLKNFNFKNYILLVLLTEKLGSSFIFLFIFIQAIRWNVKLEDRTSSVEVLLLTT